MVEVNLWHLILVCAVFMALCMWIGYANGYKSGHLRGYIDAMKAGREQAP